MSRKAPNPPPKTKRKPPPPVIPSRFSNVSLKDIFSNAMPTENYAVQILSEIREALGVGSKPMLSDLPEIAHRIRQGYERYEKVRKMNPNQFAELWRDALYAGTFDELLDRLEPK